MTNHYHLLIETPDGNLSKGMRQLNGVYTWSCCRATLGAAPCPPRLPRDWLLSTFGETERSAVSAFRRFVEDGIGQPGPWAQLRHQALLGSETFVGGLRRQLPPDRDLAEIPRAQRHPQPKPLSEYACTHRDRVGAWAEAPASRNAAPWLPAGCSRERLKD